MIPNARQRDGRAAASANAEGGVARIHQDPSPGDPLPLSCEDVDDDEDEHVWRCAWCPTKPAVPGVIYTDGICAACRVRYFPTVARKLAARWPG